MNAPVLAHRQVQPGGAGGATCLGFELNEQTPALFTMNQVQEIIVLPAQQITPMPNMPPCVLGLSTRRSRVLWLVDLAYMLLATPLPSNIRNYNVVIIRVAQRSQQQSMFISSAHNQVLLGLVVPTMRGVVHVAPELVQKPKGYFSPGLMPCLRGCLLQQDEMLLVLDAEAIARSPMLQSSWE